MKDSGPPDLTPLPYPYQALQPFLSRQVVEWHHTRYHASLAAGYEQVQRSLARFEGNPDANGGRFWELKRRLPFFSSGLILHEIYWRNMHHAGQRQPSGDLAARLRRDFGSYEQWVEDFTATAMVPSNGWAVLIHDPSTHRLRNVAVESNHEGAVWGSLVLVACDVWEHAYYAHYGPRRLDYVRAFIDLLHWGPISDRLYRSPFGAAQPGAMPGARRLAPLSFSPDALRGISSQTVRWHYMEHYAPLVRARNLLEKRLQRVAPGGAAFNPDEFADLKRQESRFGAGQELHELQWQLLGGVAERPEGELLRAMENTFGSLQGWYADFLATAAAAQSGWVLLAWDSRARRLVNLLVEANHIGALWQSTPLLPLDLWEHAYYYDRGADRQAYIGAWLANVRWSKVAERFRERL